MGCYCEYWRFGIIPYVFWSHRVCECVSVGVVVIRGYVMGCRGYWLDLIIW